MKSLIFIIVIFLSSCRSIPRCDDCKVYAGNSENMSVDRAQENEQIRCESPKFDEMLCFTQDGFQAFVETYINGCARWDTRKRSLQFFRDNETQLKRFYKKK